MQPTPPMSLSDLLDRASITDVLNAYAYGLDRRDWPAYRSIFTDTIDVDFFTFSGIRQSYDADDWVTIVRGNLAGFDSTQHTFSNHSITLQGDQASCIVSMVARHNLTVDGTLQHQSLGGFYTDRLVRTAAGWKIAGCALTITWEEGDRLLFQLARTLGPRTRIDVGNQGI